MDQQYIIINDARVYVADTLPPFTTNRRGILDRAWANTHAYDASNEYKLSVATPPQIGTLQRVLAYTVYDPIVPVDYRWESVGRYNKQDTIEHVRTRLQWDDDIIQQWFEADDVLKLLDAAKSWDELVMAVECVCGGHEVDPKLRQYVDAVLPHYSTH